LIVHYKFIRCRASYQKVGYLVKSCTFWGSLGIV
jgi:hypothetical protein